MSTAGFVGYILNEKEYYIELFALFMRDMGILHPYKTLSTQ